MSASVSSWKAPAATAGRRRGVAAAILLGILALTGESGRVLAKPPASTAGSSAIGRIAELRAPASGGTVPGRAVRLRAVVTFVRARPAAVFIEDPTGALVLPLPDLSGLEPGLEVSVEGAVAASPLGPTVAPARVVPTGRRMPLGPVDMAMPALVPQRDHGRLVRVEGIVRAAEIRDETEGFILLLASGGRQLRILVADPGSLPPDLVDSRVAVAGVCDPVLNEKGELVDLRLIARDAAAIAVRRPRPDPATLPLVPIGRLGPLAAAHHEQRVRVRGIVTLQRPGRSLFIEDASGPIFVQTRQPTRVEPGEMVEVLGFLTTDDVVEIASASFRVIGKGQPVQPTPITVAEAASWRFEDDLVQLDAVLVARFVDDGLVTMVFEADGTSFSGAVEGPGVARAFADLEPGSRVRVVGVLIGESTPAGRQGFRLRLRDRDDVVVLGGNT